MAFIRLKKIKKSPRGQSLMETIVAIAILLAVVSAVLSLVFSNIAGQKESELQIMANNLAREEIEVVRHLRDSNSLAGQDWDFGLDGGAKAIVFFDASLNQWRLIFAGEEYDERLYFSAGKKIYSHDKNSGPPALFSRHLNLSDICLAADGAESIKDSCDREANERKIGLKAGAVVGWPENKRTRQVVLEELLYAWK
ncbi:MAG: hypothetical protein A3J65_00040 [Candidatus Buchananbacteria bacterium RIFCSPHIGHO2_02_FULL_45_11b]|uniref:Prepilin-type N-terminal cleavage/methylation domain-containing protein n=3 Tax=Candidatus Buchananiibacteriota TaxID=1817903 RepID=A0A1G1Y760_9BACT|nr:MAG: hypothetical protein A2663_04165 [Candidatus Buchananbacteria bacterium RIFCSPHIGHO2_01_FULL_46_12]OGY50324.1 MAG: hypothetical protein A3J65_00040 [Candidatus Buchananbacteria bacterium RIFCSPHIGHO2_02_FULL_45_11b]OGY57456.1 MAG: hypothetical protein A3H67_02275 [Candidatus Buchananbacteria bacterium RIFCSPLOWO2_02_FULL_46_11b]